MNSKFLYAATVALSLISTLAMADAVPITRAPLKAEIRQAIDSGTLHRTDGDDAARPFSCPATMPG